MDRLSGHRATTGQPEGFDKTLGRSARKASPLGLNHRDVEMGACAAYVEALRICAPAVAQILEVVEPDVVEKRLLERSTDEFIVQIDAGRFLAEIARIWRVPASDLNAWMASDPERLSRARKALKRQAELWDWVGLQVLLHAPADRVEITRAEKIAQHCRWRAEALSKEEYGRVARAAKADLPNVREMTTRELEVIARNDLLPG